MQASYPEADRRYTTAQDCDSLSELVAAWNKLNESSMRLEQENQALLKRILARVGDSDQASLEAKYKRLKRKYLALNLGVFAKANSASISK